MTIDTYHCEWKDAVEDPEKLKKFKHFSNTDDLDETIKFIQRRPNRPAKLDEKTEAGV